MIINSGIRDFFSAEAKALIDSYKHIESLIPSLKKKGASHPSEEGRYIESLIRSFLNQHLPTGLRAFSGFILRTSKTQEDKFTSQLDVIVYDVANFPVYVTFEEFAIVPPEGVIAVISIKKTLRYEDINSEIEALSKAVKYSSHLNKNGEWVRGPYTALIAFSSKSTSPYQEQAKLIFEKLAKIPKLLPFDRLINQITVIEAYTVFKTKPRFDSAGQVRQATYVFQEHIENKLHLGLQFLLLGILSSYYDTTRSNTVVPRFTNIEASFDRDPQELGDVKVERLRVEYED